MINNSKKFMGGMCATLLALILFGFTQPSRHITVWLAGDSTMADKQQKEFPETGWGTPFKTFFDTSVTVKNIAKNGRSTKTFINEGLWQSIVSSLKPGDYVLVQFGHNDEVPTKASATTQEQYHDNLVRYVTETRARQAIPILLTSVARRKFDASGKVQGTHDVYAEIVREVAAALNVPLIDHDRESQALLQKYGPETSKLLYNHLDAGEHPNYPDGRADDTHFSELGARKMAEIVLADIRKLDLDLKNHIVKGSFPNNVPAAAK